MADKENPAAELTSALARLDQQWKIQQRSKPSSRWTKIVLDDETKSETFAQEDPYVPKIDLPDEVENFVYLLEPPGKTLPSCVIVFLGGAGLGTYPQIAYNELLVRISDRLNAAILTAPYNVGLDHFKIAKKAGDKLRRALIRCEEDPDRLYPVNLPTYGLAHSLGCKLMTIYLAATNQDFEGIGLMSFNNFSFGKTVSMAREFADEIQKGMQRPGLGSEGRGSEILNQVFGFAEMAISAVGIDFTPTSADTERLIQMKYDSEQQQKTRMFSFDEDRLENTVDFVEACTGTGPAVSTLPGTHLTPVFFKLGLDQIPEEARGIAKEATGGFESASFGNEVELQSLVDEVCDWILGKGPSRRPDWQKEKPQIAAAQSQDGAEEQ